jgi:hypothetical protein
MHQLRFGLDLQGFGRLLFAVSVRRRGQVQIPRQDERCAIGIDGYSIVAYLKAVYRIQCPLDERAASNTYCSPLSHLEGLCSFIRS